MRPLFLALLVCMLCGCSETPRLSKNPEAAKQQIEKLVPVGTSRDEAMRILTEFGFECSVQTGRYGDETFKEYIYGDYRANAGWVDSNDWAIAVILKDGQVVDYRLYYHVESL